MGNKQTELNNSGNQVETVPVWVKPYLTIDEATAYTGILLLVKITFGEKENGHSLFSLA